MKKYFIFYFFVCQINSYAQHSTVLESDFESKTISVEFYKINNINTHNQTGIEISESETDIEYKNQKTLINIRIPAHCILNPLLIIKNTIKKLNLSQSLDLDYLFFPKKQVATVLSQQKLIRINCAYIKQNSFILFC